MKNLFLYYFILNSLKNKVIYYHSILIQQLIFLYQVLENNIKEPKINLLFYYNSSFKIH